MISGQSVSNGTTAFSSTNYWSSLTTYPAYVYDSNSILYNYVENYKTYLESKGAAVEEARLIKVEELDALGCSSSSYSCSGAPSWVYSTTYWPGEAWGYNQIWLVVSNGEFGVNDWNAKREAGVRPVIKLLLSEL